MSSSPFGQKERIGILSKYLKYVRRYLAYVTGVHDCNTARHVIDDMPNLIVVDSSDEGVCSYYHS